MQLPAPPIDAPPDGLAWVRAARDLVAPLADLARASDEPGGSPAPELDTLREAGLLTAPLDGLLAPENAHALYAVLRAVGRGSLPAGRIYEGHVNALALVEGYGTEDQRARAAEDARAGHVFGVWNTGAGDDVTFRPRPDGGLRLDGAKVFCSGVGLVTRPFANGALPDGGWQMAIVPVDEASPKEDAAWWKAEGMRASASGRVDFSGVEIGPEWVVGAPGDYLREPLFNGGAVRFAAVQLGGADALAAATLDHLRRLDRLDHPVQQVRIGEMMTLLETGGLWLLGAARMQNRDGAPASDIVAYAQMARSAIERVCLDVLERADRAVGARGLLPPSPVERVGRDLRLYLRQPNPDGVVAAAGAHAATASGQALGSDPA